MGGKTWGVSFLFAEGHVVDQQNCSRPLKTPNGHFMLEKLI